MEIICVPLYINIFFKLKFISTTYILHHTLHTVHTIQIVEKRVKEVQYLYNVYPYNCLTKYIMHLKSAMEGVTTLFTCITIPHLIERRYWNNY